MPARARLARSIARVEALPLPWRPSLPQVRPRAWLADAAPTRRSIAIGFAALAVALGARVSRRKAAGGARRLSRAGEGGRASDGGERELRPGLPTHAAYHRRAG